MFPYVNMHIYCYFTGLKAPPDWHFFMSLCRYAPCVRQNPQMFSAEYAQRRDGTTT